MKDIAVVLPVYNGADMLESCVCSICTAGSRISEIIIVDDGSTDETLNTAQKLAKNDSRIRVIHTDNHGTYMARITGMRAAGASYVASIDADDRFCEGCLDMLADLLEKYDADVAIGGLIETANLDETEQRLSALAEASKAGADISIASSPKDNTPPYKIRVSKAGQMWPRIMKWKTQEFVCYINKLYKRELLTDLVDADGICQGEDVLITCQAFLKVEKIVETTAPMYLYYINPESLTHIGFGDHDLDVLRVWDIVVSVMRQKRPDLLPMAQFNRWRTDFTLITRLILVDNRELDRKYARDLAVWRRNLKKHWKDLISPHAMPLNREVLVVGLRFFFRPVKNLMRIGRRLSKKDISIILHSGDKR